MYNGDNESWKRCPHACSTLTVENLRMHACRVFFRLWGHQRGNNRQ